MILVRTTVTLAFGLLACRPSTATPPADAEHVATARHREEVETESARGTPEPPRDPVPQPRHDPEINARYERERSSALWQSRLEQSGREVYDRKAFIVETLALAAGASVADVGAGTGLFTLEFSAVVGDQGNVFAVDVQDYLLAHIERRALQAGFRNVHTILATQSDAKLAHASVDLVFLCDAYHHIEDPIVYLQSLRRALRPGGRLVVIDFDRARLEEDSWIHGHVRSSAADFRKEIEYAGFRFTREHPGLRENFFFEFAPLP